MVKSTKRPNGTIKRVQYTKAIRKGVSSMGSPYEKGDAILHLSSSRCTGETFVLLPTELTATLATKPGRWASPKKWSEQLRKKWVKAYVKMHGHDVGQCSTANHPPEFWSQKFPKPGRSK